LISNLFALDSDKAITQYVHDVWKIEQGLPVNGVNDILQTRDGYLWFTSHETLTRFDGVKFTVFDSRKVTFFHLPLLLMK